MSFQICTDIGGTFTDLYIRSDDDEVRSIKSPTTPDNLTDGLFDAVSKAADEFDRSIETLLGETERFIHGTTVATNAIIENDVSTTALICTSGHREILTLREGGKENPYDWDVDYPDPYIPRSLTFGVTERVNAEGEIVMPLDETECRETIETIRDHHVDVDAVAVSLLWAHQNPAHERRIGELLDELAPELDIALSSTVCPIVREYRRTSATAINASLYGVVDDYLVTLREELAHHGFDGTALIITANGGVMGIDEITRTPIWMVDAGPTMFPAAARTIVRMEADEDSVIALDMGGTSTDMGVVTGGNVSRSREATVEGDHMLGIEKVDVRSIGSGGGSIAWVDDGGLLHVGPRSAGADPGPACYGRGGEEPTVTDAALVLGYLNPEYFLGGAMTVDVREAEHAIEERVGDPLGLDAVDAAYAIYTTANQNVINGVKEITIERGINPRKYALSGGGGALGTHVVPIARELQIGDVYLPRDAGVVSAVGGLTSDIRRDFSESFYTTKSTFDVSGVNEALHSLESKSTAFFERANIPSTEQSRSYFVEARYPNQVWELDVELPFARVSKERSGTLVDRFHDVHESTYGFKIEDQDVEFLQWRVEASGETARSDRLISSRIDADSSGGTAHEERDAYVDGRVRSCPAYRPRALAPDQSIEGPAFVDAETTTIVLPPDSTLTTTSFGTYHIVP